jgi:hypothetical protein
MAERMVWVWDDLTQDMVQVPEEYDPDDYEYEPNPEDDNGP